MSTGGIIYRNNQSYQSTTIRLGANSTIQCDARGSLALADTWASCLAYQLPFIMEMIGFGYFTMFLSGVIVAISIFGGIKDSYRWFILNQAFWDIFISYDFICDKPTYQYFLRVDPIIAKQEWNEGPATCFYSANPSSTSLGKFIERFLQSSFNNIPFPLVFLLSFSRVIAIYSPVANQHSNSSLKIPIFLLVLNLISLIIINFEPIYNQISKTIAVSACNCEVCPCTVGFYEPTQNFVLLGILPLFTLGCLILTAILTVLVFSKIIYQFKFALHHHRKNLINSFRVATVLLVHFLMACLLFMLIFFGEFLNFWLLQFISDEAIDQVSNITPTWIKRLRMAPECLNLLRSFVDSIMILVALTGYRNGLKYFGIFIFAFVVNPKKIWNEKIVGKKSRRLTTNTIVFVESRI